MSLVACPECHNEISDKATTCPKCGFPLKQKVVTHLLSTSASTTAAGIQAVTGFFRSRRYKFYAVAKCFVILSIGALIFQFVVHLGAICMAIYSGALFRLTWVVWKRTVNAETLVSKAKTQVLERVPDDDTRFMPPNMRSAAAETTISNNDAAPTAIASPSRDNTASDNKKSSSDPTFSFLPRALFIFIVCVILSIILRPILYERIRDSSFPPFSPPKQAGLLKALDDRYVAYERKLNLDTERFGGTQAGKRRIKIVNGRIEVIGEDESSNVVTTTLLTPLKPVTNQEPNRSLKSTNWINITNLARLTFGYPSDIIEEQSAAEQSIGNAYKETVLGKGALSGRNTVRLQQKGLSSRLPESLKTYLRISITQSESVPDSLSFLNRLDQITNEDLQLFDDSMRESLTSSFKEVGKTWRTFKLTSAPASRIISLGGKCVLKTTFSRQMDDQPVVTQREYRTVANAGLITITTQYRDEELDRWGKAVDDVVNSIRFR